MIKINVYQDKRRESNNLFYGRTIKLTTLDHQCNMHRSVRTTGYFDSITTPSCFMPSILMVQG